METLQNDMDIVADPVAHISISGIHTVDEIAEHVAGTPPQMVRRGSRGASLGSLLIAAAIGAGLMYLLDPDGGRRRRALARDKAVHLKNTIAGRTVDVSSSPPTLP